jgi:hypothetical protein
LATGTKPVGVHRSRTQKRMGTWPYEASSAGVTSSISISFKFDLIEMKPKDVSKSSGRMP